MNADQADFRGSEVKKDDKPICGNPLNPRSSASHCLPLRLPLRGLAALCLLLPACQQYMANQPEDHKPLRPSTFFADGRASRPLVPGTVARGLPLSDDPLVVATRGRIEHTPLKPADYVSEFPFPITEAALQRGQQRYDIYCAVCHDASGNGNGKIVERGYLRPPSYVTDLSRGFQRRGIKVLLRDAPVGYYFEVISQGYGAMPDYATQVSPEDRWKIIAYIHVLQLSQHAPLAQLPPSEREKAEGAVRRGGAGAAPAGNGENKP
jgi:mono/diheme cytochrome c family protein